MKSKKKLLIAMAAMSVAAIGAGTVSTFAWFAASTTAKSALTENNDSVTVGEAIYSLGDVGIEMKLTATASMTNVGFAHYGGTSDAQSHTGAKPYLTTGYQDGNNVFHDLGYRTDVGNVGKPVLYGSITDLYTTLTVTIDVNFASTFVLNTSGGWYSDQACNTPVNTRTNANYYKDKNGNILLGSAVLDQLDGLEVDVGVKSNGSRVRFFYDTADSNDADLAGITGDALVTINSTSYAKVGADKQSLEGIKTAAVTTGASPTFYVLGTNATAETGDVAITNGVALAISAGTIRPVEP